MTMTSSDREAEAGPRPRRAFTPEQKADFVRRYDETPNGGKGAFLRENNLYESHIYKWKRAASTPAKVGDPARQRVTDLEAQNAALREELAASRRTADALGKAYALLEKISKGADTRTGPANIDRVRERIGGRSFDTNRVRDDRTVAGHAVPAPHQSTH